MIHNLSSKLCTHMIMTYLIFSSFGATLTYRLECTNSPCPLFDPQDQRIISDDGKQMTFRLQKDIEIGINLCENSNSCQCYVQTSLEKKTSITAGSDNLELGTLTINNSGTEPAVGTNLILTINDKSSCGNDEVLFALVTER